MKDFKFSDFDLSDEIQKAISAMGFEEPTPIQKEAIPAVLSGRDVIGQAQTGTGKTAAFGIPILERLEKNTFTPQAIILTPTRELAIQVAEEMNKLGRLKRVSALPIYGGTSIERQIKALKKGIQIIAGTPGRVIDHIERRTLRLGNIKTVVLDEADEMLDMGFLDDINKILKTTPAERQTLLFSATMPSEILKISKRYMKSPEKVKIPTDTLTASKVEQIVYEVRANEKMEALCRLIDSEDSGLFLVFCHTKREVDDVASNLKLRGYEVEAIHGDFTQAQREAVLKKFKASKIDILVATDVAARGLDISAISHVVNFSIPQNPESYVHRIGRTGRAGKEGVAITFVTPREDKQLRLIKAISKASIRRGKLPSVEEVMEARVESLNEKIQEFVDDKRFDLFLKMAEKLSEKTEPTWVSAALLKFLLEGYGTGIGQKEPPSFADTGAAPGMVRLFMTVGRAQNIKANDIVKAISERAKIPTKAIGTINIFDKFTFVEVPRSAAEEVIEVMHRSIISGRKVAVAPAKPRGKTTR